MREVKEVKSIYVTKYEASDGARFNTEQECIEHEAKLNAKRSLVESIECTTCWIPFSNWDMEADESKLYLIKNEEEFEALRDYYSEEFSSDSDWWDEPKVYPTTYLVLARECYVTGYRLDKNVVDNFTNVAKLISEYLYKAEQL